MTTKKFAMEAWGIMGCRVRTLLLASAGAVASVAISDIGYTQEATTPDPYKELLDLKLDIVAQQERMAEQERQLAEQARRLEEQRRAFERQQEQINALQADANARRYSQGTPQVIPAVGRGAVAAPAGDARTVQVQAQPETPPAAVGEAPKEETERRPEVAALVEVGGVLTTPGTIVLEPSFQFSHSSVNRFVFQGIEIVDAVLIGLIEASDADRDTLTAGLTGRVGLTNRLEVEARVPYVYRKDRVTNLILGGNNNGIRSELDGNGIGDVEFGAHYQINSGQGGWPYFVGNVRVKSDTGTSPFKVDRDVNGIEQELATGSGFWGVQPSLTAIYPSDPAVFYANVGYLWNIERDIDRTIGGSLIGTVDPGDNVSFSFGMGFGINERASFNLGYEHNFILETSTEINGVENDSDTLQVGSLTLGLSYRLSDMVGLNLNLAIGATTDAPDASLTFRVPISISDVF